MIQLEHLNVQEFRGIRSLDLPLDSKSFVVYGPNGSGKSGVVDAIDFALTGSVARLSGAGTAGVTIAKHAPHIHKRDDPGSAKVSLTVKDLETGEVAIISRSVKNAATYTLTPDTPAIRRAVEHAMDHPELTLSRRELIKYVVSKPGDRAAEVQSLLKLERVESVRKILKSTSTKASGDAKLTDSEQDQAERSFESHLGLQSLLSAEVLREINQRRKVLGLSDLEAFTTKTNVLEGHATEKKGIQLDLVTARLEVATLRTTLTKLNEISTTFDALDKELKPIAEDPHVLDSIRHRSLLEAGLSAIEGRACPLCDTIWECREDLERHVKGRIATTDVAQALKDRIITAATLCQTAVRQLREDARKVESSAKLYGTDELPHLLKTWSDALAAAEIGLGRFETVIDLESGVSRDSCSPSDELVKGIGILANALNNAPDQSAEDTASGFLTVAKDRWTRVRLARAAAEKAASVKAAAFAIYDANCIATDNALAELYRTVEKDFSAFYQFVNSDDESAFRAELQPSSGSLDLSVDFYSLGMFPPAAYHSEGHQDGMGVCLYLALVKQLLGDDFRYAVLDDVVMSVDSNHRRRFAELLKSKFPDVQFIITTHDEVWARQMRSAGVVAAKSMARFHGWTVDAGPVYGSNDVLTRIEQDLNANDVAGAAHKLRRMLEASAADIAEGIGGNVTYRSDGAYDLSAFLDAVKGRHGKLLNLAAVSAQSWENSADIANVAALKSARAAVVPEQGAEAWLVNKLVHNTDWANVTVADFRPVLQASQSFLGLFVCVNTACDSWIAVETRAGSEGSVRCACQSYSLNLQKKPQ